MIHLDTRCLLSISTFLDLVDDLTPLQGNTLVAASIAIVYVYQCVCGWGERGKSGHMSGRIYISYESPAMPCTYNLCLV